MYRSWAYILMVGATLVGVVALLWPSPEVRSIEDIASAARQPPPRAESPAKPAKPPAKAAQAKAASKAAAEAPPAVVKRIPPQNTSTKRAGPLLQNGLQPGIVINPNVPPTPAPARPASK